MENGVPQLPQVTAPAKRGPKPKGDKKLHKKTLSALESEWKWIMLFAPDDDVSNPSAAFRELLDRAQRMAPSGPRSFGHNVRRSRHVVPGSKVKRWSLPGVEDDLTNRERVALIVQRYAEEHPEEFV